MKGKDMMNKRKLLVSLSVVFVLACMMYVILRLKGNHIARNNSKTTPSPTSIVTPGPSDDVDEAMLQKLYTEKFPFCSPVCESNKNNKEFYAIRLDISKEEWDAARERLAEAEWTSLDIGNGPRLLDNGIAAELFSEAERNTWTEHWFIIHNVEIPNKHAVDEEVWVMHDETKNLVLIFYWVSVY